MKHLKHIVLSLLLIASSLISCTNDDPLVEEQDTEESASITATLAQLSLQYNAQGNLIATQNQTGNIVFDFCFDFVYPLSLSYNNGTTVSVNNLDALIDIIISSNNELFINGISFPFEVETYNDANNTIEIVSINNEAEFAALLESCEFTNTSNCECYEVYQPVCVEITAPDGTTFTMTYPNACYAECDGFTTSDFVDNCANDFNFPGEFDCFTFNFPISIITDTGETLVLNSQEEFSNALYNVYYFDFVYSFDVTFNDGTILTIGNEEALIELIETCLNPGACPCPANVIPVCVEYELPNGAVTIITFLNPCEAECQGYTPNDFIDCGNSVNPSCSLDDAQDALLSCSWTVNIGDETFSYVFTDDGIITITEISTTFPYTATWILTAGIAGIPSLIINEEFGQFEDEWVFVNCEDGAFDVFSTINPNETLITPDCN
ncbi:MAG: hypothetical protein WA775_01290 [Psychroserpens sp.]|uniref:hypothetical protein n=1 Tax=Psychroserpens sp. TaxID=2020870 RepID=UPI003C995075